MKKIIIVVISVVILFGFFYILDDNTNDATKRINEKSKDVLKEDNSLNNKKDNPIIEVDNNSNINDEHFSEYSYKELQEIKEKIDNHYCVFSKKLIINAFEKNKNEIVSPYSIFNLLALIANGTDGESRTQIEDILGVDISVFNEYLISRKGDNTYKMANLLCLNSDYGIEFKQDFSNVINKYYGPKYIEKSFSDSDNTIKEINEWSSKQTEGAIEDIVGFSDVNPSNPLLALNALCAGDEWRQEFVVDDTYQDDFTNYDDSISNTMYMFDELIGYWHDLESEGFIKTLDNGEEFIAIIPNKGIDIYDFINEMSPTIFSDYRDNYICFDNIEGDTADIHITRLSFPKYSYDTDYHLNDSLIELGISNIFDAKSADFSNMVEGDKALIDNLFIQSISQKDKIMVDEKKVVAFAVTKAAFGMGGGDYNLRNYIYHDIIFNRPFIYAILDGREPIFIGIVANVNNISQ